MKKELLILYLTALHVTTILQTSQPTTPTLIQDSKSIKEVRYLKSESTGKQTDALSPKADVEHPFCRMDTKKIFVQSDEEFVEQRGVKIVDERFHNLCKGLDYSCCSINELRFLMDATKSQIVDMLADSLIDFGSLHSTLISFDTSVMEQYLIKKPERVQKCTNKDPHNFMLFYSNVIGMLAELEDDKQTYKILSIMNSYYKHVSAQAYEDNCRLCDPFENRYLSFNNQTLKFEVEFYTKGTVRQYYNRIFYDRKVLKLVLLIKSLECITSFNTHFINIGHVLDVERAAARIVAENDYSQKDLLLGSGFLEFLNFNPFSFVIIRFAHVSKVLENIRGSSNSENASFFEKYPALDIQLRTYYPPFIKKHSTYNYDKDFGFFSNDAVSFNMEANTEYTESLKIFKDAKIQTAALFTILAHLLLY